MRNLSGKILALCLLALLLLAVTAGRTTKKSLASKDKSPYSLRLRSPAAVVVDMENRVILYEKNPTLQRSVASITKLMTVLVFRELTVDLDHPVIIQNHDRTSTASNFPVGNSYRLIDLLHGVLMASDNRAAMALARATGLSVEEFVSRMNDKAAQLGLWDTRFADPTGLKEENVSSALDCVKLIETALQDTLIAQISTKKEYRCRSTLKKRPVTLYNTNRLLSHDDMQILGGKTGFIRRSGYCLATCVGDRNGKKIAFILLGAPSNTLRFQEMYKLIRWTSQNYKLAIS
ncbi:MAG: hypothetical protein A2V86_04315 [Deltaproteobacteria bacterium RBG_16_49_23]|nr:MAG: hypothetical protein A2V86_04315 [Deltaproteobacteria bacterium RBG_16_49_23]